MDYDVVTTFADHNAVPFFAKQGFNDDKILNSRYISYLVRLSIVLILTFF